MKYLRREVALNCPIHKTIKYEAAQRLEAVGYFSKQEVLEACSFAAMQDAVRWDYIREFIQEDEGCELIPVAARFFKRHSNEAIRTRPEKFVAGGNGKKTAGYVSVKTDENKALAIYRIERRKGLVNGQLDAFNAFRKAIVDHAAPGLKEELEGEKKKLPRTATLRLSRDPRRE